MCQVLGVSPSAFYAWCQRPVSAHQQRDEELSLLIHQIYKESCGRYGSPRVYHELRGQGVRCSEKRVARLMHEHHLVARKRRHFVSTTNSRHAHPVADNVLNRQYQVEVVAAEPLLSEERAETLTAILFVLEPGKPS